MELPKSVKFILNKLYENEYEGYVVGGCVRDMLLNKTPKDWDICTNAKPDQIMQVFKGFNIILTGLQHGTVTVVIDKIGYEITTYRIDGDYSDGRHPDNVKFTPELCEDLARRDFTINAMAYSEEEGIVDLYNGVEDLQKRVIRCVGNPEERFSEDALRIMRAMRFASVLDFKIEDKTDKAMKKLYENLGKVSKERINAELSKLLLGKGSKKVLKKYDYILGYIIPDVKNMIGFVQNNPHHCYDVYEHTVEVVDNVKEADLPLKLAALLHDIGKPLVYTVDDKGIGHFKGHAKKSGELAEKILKDLKYSNEIIRETLLLIVYHDFNVSLTNSFIRRMLNKLGPETFNKLLVLRKADIDGQSEYKKEEKLKEVEDLKNLYKDFKLEDECFNLKQLKINGKDLINLGIPSGREMGDILKDIFQKVLDGHLENDEYTLTSYVKGKYLDMGNKKRLIEIAEETIQISEKGSYQIGPRIYTFDTTNNTKLFENLDDVISKVKQKQAISQKAKIEIRNEGTVDAVLRLAKGKNLELGVLNFASAHNPGGGFVYGAIAQEECIAYCSDLYTKQITGEGKKYYSINANCKTPAYTDTMFMSNVTFFRRGDYSFTPTPTMCNVLTCPAVNMGALRNRPNFDFETAKKIMKDRMRKIIYLFAYYGCKDLVLGAYGCGVFGNSPEDVAQDWYDILIEEGMEKYFNSVTFSIIDSPNRVSNIDVFKNVFKI